MNPHPSPLLFASAAVYFAAGLLLLFAPEESLELCGVPTTLLDVALLQVIGSALFGFAMLNWLSRHTRIGGIFGRPLVAANLAHAGSAALLLAHLARRSNLAAPLAVALALYGALAIGFGIRLVRPPEGFEPHR
jgi:hypothetical protein